MENKQTNVKNDEQVLEVKNREFESKTLFWITTFICFFGRFSSFI